MKTGQDQIIQSQDAKNSSFSNKQLEDQNQNENPIQIKSSQTSFERVQMIQEAKNVLKKGKLNFKPESKASKKLQAINISNIDKRKIKSNVGTDPLQSDQNQSIDESQPNQNLTFNREYISIPTAQRKQKGEDGKETSAKFHIANSFKISSSLAQNRQKLKKEILENPILVTKQLLPPKSSSTSRSVKMQLVVNQNIKSSASQDQNESNQQASQRLKTESEIYADFQNFQYNSQTDKFDYNATNTKQILHDDQNEKKKAQPYNTNLIQDQKFVAYGKQFKNFHVRMSEQNDQGNFKFFQNQNKINFRQKIESQSHDFNKTQQTYYANLKGKLNLWTSSNQQKVFNHQILSPMQIRPEFEIKGKSALYQTRLKQNKESERQTISEEKAYTDRKKAPSTIENSYKNDSKERQSRKQRESVNVNAVNTNSIVTNRIINLTDSSSIEDSKQIFDALSDDIENRINFNNYSRQNDNIRSLKKQLQKRDFIPTSQRYEIQRGQNYMTNFINEIQRSKEFQNIGTQRLPENLQEESKFIINKQVDKNILKMGIILKSLDSSSNYHSEVQSRQGTRKNSINQNKIQNLKEKFQSIFIDPNRIPQQILHNREKFNPKDRIIQNSYVINRIKQPQKTKVGPIKKFTIPDFITRQKILQKVQEQQLYNSTMNSPLSENKDSVMQDFKEKEDIQNKKLMKMLNNMQLNLKQSKILMSDTENQLIEEIDEQYYRAQMKNGRKSTNEQLQNSKRLLSKMNQSAQPSEAKLMRTIQDQDYIQFKPKYLDQQNFHEPSTQKKKIENKSNRMSQTSQTTINKKSEVTEQIIQVVTPNYAQIPQSLDQFVKYNQNSRTQTAEAVSNYLRHKIENSSQNVSVLKQAAIPPNHEENLGEQLFNSIDFVQKSPLRYHLHDDEEFIIINYRLIKRKKNLNITKKNVQQTGRVVSPMSFSSQNSPKQTEIINFQDQKNENFVLELTNSKNNLEEEKFVFQSKIEALNSIICPHKYKFSTHIGKTSEMYWNEVAQISLRDVNQENFILTLDGKFYPSQIEQFQNQLQTDQQTSLDADQNIKQIEKIEEIQQETSQSQNIQNEETDENSQKYTKAQYKFKLNCIEQWLDDELLSTFNIDEYWQNINKDLIIQQQEKSQGVTVEPSIQQMYKGNSKYSMVQQDIVNEDEIAQQVNINQNQTIVKERTGREPYKHLKSKNVFLNEAIQYENLVRQIDSIEDQNEKTIMTIDLNKKFVSALDKKKGVAETMSLDFFIDNYQKELKMIMEQLNDRKLKGLGPLQAKSFYYKMNGQTDIIDVEILEYDRNIKKFIIEFVNSQGLKVMKQSGRLNLIFENIDTAESVQRRFQNAQKRRKLALSGLAEERIILNELVKIYTNIKMPLQVKKKICQLIKQKLNYCKNPQFFLNLLIQVEALYVYQTLKSVIYSQQNDSIIKKLAHKYLLKTNQKIIVDIDGTIFKKYEISQFDKEYREKFQNNMQAVNSQFVHNNQNLIGLVEFIYKQSREVFDQYPLFEIPSMLNHEAISYLLSQKDFTQFTDEKFKILIQTFPNDLSNLQKIIEYISKRFRSVLIQKWYNKISIEVEKILQNDEQLKKYRGKINETQIKIQSQINPCLQKCFNFINIILESMMFEKMKDSMQKYLIFLLQFLKRNEEISESPQFSKLGLNDIIIKIQNQPLLQIQIQIVKKKVKFADQQKSFSKVSNSKNLVKPEDQTQNQEKKYVQEIQTSPDITDFWNYLQRIVNDLSNQMSGLNRMEQILYPLLQDTRKYLLAPSPSSISELLAIDNQIQWLLLQAKEKPQRILERLQKFFDIYTLNYDQMIIQIRIQILKKQDEEYYYEFSQKYNELLHTQNKNEKQIQEINEYEMELQQIEISRNDYKNKFKELECLYWQIQLEIENQYDFGIILFNTEQFKNQVITKINYLIQKMSNDLENQFLESQNILYQQFEEIEIRLNTRYDSIDEIISQIDYIQDLVKDSSIVHELADKFTEIRSNKNFLDSLNIKLQSNDFQRYLRIYIFPSDILDLIIYKEKQIKYEKQRINQMLQNDVGNVYEIIDKCKKILEIFKVKGLQSKREIEKEAIKENASREIQRAWREMQKNNEPYLNKEYLHKNYLEIKKIEEEIKNTKDIIIKLNYRQKQLNLEQSEFPETQQLYDEIYPFKELWEVAFEYVDKRQSWWSTKLNSFETDNVSSKVDQWQITLDRLKKNPLIIAKSGPKQLREYISKEVSDVKEFLPIVQCLTSKGLEKRHFDEMSLQLGINVDPSLLNLKQLKTQGLTQDKALEAIRGVSETAYKENALKMAIDRVERDIKELTFKCETIPVKKIRIIKDFESVFQSFDDITLKIQSLKGNKFVKSLFEKLEKYENDIQFLQTSFESWIKIQKAWLYLEPIYQQKEVSTDLVEQKKIFEEFNLDFKKVMSQSNTSAEINHVVDFVKNDGFISKANGMLEDIEYLEKSLSDFLNKKREEFARLYFTSNEELIQLMGNLKNQNFLQLFLFKLFDGIAGLLFDEEQIVGIKSSSGENMILNKKIKINIPPEVWLQQLEIAMKSTLYNNIDSTYIQFTEIQEQKVRFNDFKKWFQSNIGQLQIMTSKMYFDNIIRNFLQQQLSQNVQENQSKKQQNLVQTLNQLNQNIEKVLSFLNESSSKNESNSCINFVLQQLYQKDFVQKYILDDSLRSQDDFQWQIQLKYNYIMHQNSKEPFQDNNDKEELKKLRKLGIPDSWDPRRAIDEDWMISLCKNNSYIAEISLSCGVATIPFGYEYIGNNQRLVITPLTDRCFRSILMSIHYQYGSSLEGVVSAGKTETIKEISKIAGKMCFVFSCSSTLKYDSIIKFFKGFVQGGSWTCFDEFNRIETSVISVLSQTINQVNQAIRNQKGQILFDDSNKPTKVNFQCAIFITMNTVQNLNSWCEIPSSLMNQFRSVQLVKPDFKMIVQATLQSNGFFNYKILTNKIMQVYQSLRDQVGSRNHYDFGIRNIKQILVSATNCLHKVLGNIEGVSLEMIDAQQLMMNFLKEKKNQDIFRQEQKLLEERQKELDQKKKKIKNSKQQETQNEKIQLRSSKNQVKSMIEDKKPLEKYIESESINLTGSLKKSFSRQQLNSALSSTDKFEIHKVVKNIENLQKILNIENLAEVSSLENLETFIIVKALHELNINKFQDDDRIIFLKIVKDVFNQIKIKRHCNNEQYDFEIKKQIQQKGLQNDSSICTTINDLHDLIMSTNGVMILGNSNSGKTTLLRIIEDAYHNIYKEEFDKRKSEYLGMKYEIFKIEDDSLMTPLQKEQHLLTLQELKTDDINTIKKVLKNKQIQSQIINPQSQKMEILMGQMNLKTNEFKDGILSSFLRQTQNQNDEKYSWIIFDGEVRIEWIENLSSCLDENKKLTLISGEQLYAKSNLRILIETDDLRYCSPAIISRYGVFHVSDSKIKIKQILNQYMRSFPKILSDQIHLFDNLVNYFIPQILFKWFNYNENADNPYQEINSNAFTIKVTPKIAIFNFIRYFELCINDYRNTKFQDWLYVKKNLAQDINEIHHENAKSENSQIPQKLFHFPDNSVNKQKFSTFKFAENYRTKSAIQFKELWIESFFIQSLVQSFLAILKQDQKPMFLEFVRNKVLKIKTDQKSQSYNLKNLEFGDQYGEEIESISSSSSSLIEISIQVPMKNEIGQTQSLQYDQRFNKLNIENSKNKVVSQFNITMDEPSKQSSLSQKSQTQSKNKILTEKIFQDLMEAQTYYIPTDVLQSPFQNKKNESLNSSKKNQDMNKSLQIQEEFSFSVSQKEHLINAKMISHQIYKEPNFITAFEGEIFKDFSNVVFDIDINQWITWEQMLYQTSLLASPQSNINDLQKSQKKNDKIQFVSKKIAELKTPIFQQFVRTSDSTKALYFMEGAFLIQTNTILFGESGSGKSRILHHLFNCQVQRFTNQFQTQNMLFYPKTQAEDVQQFFEENFEKKRKGFYTPYNNKKLVIFIDDLSMTIRQNEDLQQSLQRVNTSVIEFLRQILNFNQWYDLQNSEKKVVENFSFISSLTNSQYIPESKKNLLQSRQLTHWLLIGFDCDYSHFKQIFSKIIDDFSVDWTDKQRINFNQKICNCTMQLQEISLKVFGKINKNKFLFSFNFHQLFRILHSMACFSYPKTIKEIDIIKLWVSESYRTIAEKFEEKALRRAWFDELQKLASAQFNINKEFLLQKVGRPYYTYITSIEKQEINYKEVDKVSALEDIIQDFINAYEKEFKKINLTIFDFMIEQLIKINRAIQQPFSNVILVGQQGLGKQSLSRLAVFIAQLKIQEISSLQDCSLNQWKHQFKNIISYCSQKNRICVLNIQEFQIQDEEVFMYLSCLLKNGQIPDLFSKLEYQIIQANVKASLGSDLSPQAASSLNQFISNEQIQRIKINVRTIISLTPLGQVLNTQLRKYQDIINLSTIIWMDNWPDQGYREVGNVYLKYEKYTPLWLMENEKKEEFIKKEVFSKGEKAQDDEQEQDEEESNDKVIIETAIQMQNDALKQMNKYIKETNHQIQMSPFTFINFFRTFNHLYKIKNKYLEELAIKYKGGSEKIQKTEQKVLQIQNQLYQTGPLLLQKQEQIEIILRELELHSKEMQMRVSFVEEEEKALNQTKSTAGLIKDECQRQFDDAIPMLKRAVAKLQKLTKSEITELKTIRKPSPAVYKLMECVCIIMEIPPKRVKIQGSVNEYQEDYWPSASSKQVLSNFQLIEILSNYNPERLNQEIMLKLKNAQSHEEFNMENINKACKAAVGIYKWMIALQNYYFVYTECKPKRDALILSEKQIHVQEDLIKERRQHLNNLQVRLAELRKAYSEKEEEVKQLNDDIEQCNIQNQRVAKLLQSLKGEKQKWKALTKIIKEKFINLEGDCIIGAGIIVFLGQLSGNYRQDVINKWINASKNNTQVPVSKYFNFIKNFGIQVEIKNWGVQKLPSDSMTITNALMIDLCPIQSIIIDPQNQANQWIREKFKENSDQLIVLHQHNIKFSFILQAAVKFGKTVLVENVGDNINKDIQVIFRNDQLRHQKDFQISISGFQTIYDPNFKLYITSELQQPNFPPEQIVQCVIINFSMTQQSLEQHLLSIFVIDKLKPLEDKFLDTKKKGVECLARIHQIENLILELLDKSIDKLLYDDSLVERIHSSAMQSKKAFKAVQKIKKKEQETQEQRNKFLPCAKRGAMLFKILTDLSQVNKLYHYSLKSFIKIYENEIQNKETVNSSLDPAIDFSNRLTRQFYLKTSLGLYQQDKLMLSFIIAYNIMKQSAKFDSNHFNFIINGPYTQDINSTMTQTEKDQKIYSKLMKQKEQKQNPRKIKLMQFWGEWMTDRQWEGLESLEKLHPFDNPSIIDHMISNHKEWEKLILQTDPYYDKSIPGPYQFYNLNEDDPIYQQYLQNQQKKQEKLEVHLTNQEIIFDIDDIFNQQDSEQRNFQTNQEENIDDQREQNETPIPKLYQNENEDAFWQRKLQFEEDEYISKQIINGLKEYTEIQLDSEEDEKQKYQKQLDLNIEIIRFCIMRIFKPDQIIENSKRFIQIFLDQSFVAFPALNYNYIINNSDYSVPNLIIKDSSQDILVELQRMQKIVQKNCPLNHIILNNQNVNQLGDLISKSALSGHWILIEDFQILIKHINKFQSFFQTVQNYQEDKENIKNKLKIKLQNLDEDQIEQQNQEMMIEKLKVDVDGSLLNVEFKLTETADFYVNKAFRLWITIDPSSDVEWPMNFIKNCQKFNFQQIQGIKQNCQRIFNQTLPEIFQGGYEFQNSYKMMFFSICFYHSLIHQRDRFGPIGWRAPYSFSNIENQIAAVYNYSFTKELKGLPPNRNHFKTFNYFLSQVIYGSKIYDDQDLNISQAIADIVINHDALNQNSYNYSGVRNSKGELQQYTAPTVFTLDGFISHCLKYPQEDIPQIFGISQNCFYKLQQQDGETLLNQIFIYQSNQSNPEYNQKQLKERQQSFKISDEASMGHKHMVKRQKTKLNDVLVKIPDKIQHSEIQKHHKKDFQNYFSIILHKEMQKYNVLIDHMQQSCNILMENIEQEFKMNVQQKEDFNRILNDETPLSWFEYSYPGFFNLPNFLVNLQERVEYIKYLISEDSEHFQKFWISGFFDPKNFLSQLQQYSASKVKKSFEEITFQVEISSIVEENKLQNKFSIEEESIIDLQQNEFYIYGFNLQCGNWNRKMRFIEDFQVENSKFEQILPGMVFKFLLKEESKYLICPRQKYQLINKLKNYQDYMKYCIQFCNNEEMLQPEMEVIDQNYNQYFWTPFYVTSERKRLPQTLIDGEVVKMLLRVDSQHSQSFWIKRGLAIILNSSQQ